MVFATDSTEKGILGARLPLHYSLIADLFVFLPRLARFCRHRSEYNVLKFVHAFVHLLIISSWIVLVVFMAKNKIKYKSNVFGFMCVLILLSFRVFVYSTYTVSFCICSPWLLKGILEKRRDRLRRRDYHTALRDNSSRQNAINAEGIQYDSEDSQMNVVEANIVDDNLLDLLRGLENYRVFDRFDLLKRVKYGDLIDSMSSEF